MNKKVVFMPLAFAGISNAYNWYGKQQKGLSLRFLNAFNDTIKHISQYPESCQKVKKNYRQAMIPGFPYLVMYINEPHEVVVYNVIDARQLQAKRFRKK